MKVGGQALPDGVLMRTSRAWAVARDDGTVEVGRFAGGGAGARVPVLRVVLGLAPALALGFRAMGRRGGGHRPDRRVVALLAAVVGVTLALPLVAGGWDRSPVSALPVDLGLAAALLVGLRLAAPPSLFRYHGAEHKAVAAHEAGFDAGDAGPACDSPRVHDRCGTNVAMVMLVIGPLLAELPAVTQAVAFVVLLAVVAEATALVARRPGGLAALVLLGPGRAVQRWITTVEPSRAEQAVACRALAACLTEHARAQSEQFASLASGGPTSAGS